MPTQVDAKYITHPKYNKYIKIWNLIDDVLEGKEAIVAKGESYLPRPEGRSDKEYEAYQRRAVFYNATARTLDGLLGGIFRKDIYVDIPEGMAYIKDDCDGEGNTLLQFSKKVTKQVLAKGRYGILVDYPVAKGFKTLDEEIKAELKARIIGFCPESIVNWKFERIGSKYVLTNVLLREDTIDSPELFSSEFVEQYRLLQLVDGYYEVALLRPEDVIDKTTNKRKRVLLEKSRYYPRLPNGRRLEQIPFFFIGSETNDSSIDKPPLADLADLNLAHYRNCADFEEAVFMIGQPTPWISGLDDGFIEKNRGFIKIGSRKAWLLPENSEVGLLESKSEKNLILKALELKEEEMIALGARLVQNNAARGSESAESVQLRKSGESSTLACIADNVSVAINKALTWVAEWMNIKTGDIIFKLNKDFFSNRLSHQEILALVEAWQARAIPHDVLIDNYRKGEIIPETMDDDKVKDLIETEEPFAIGSGIDMMNSGIVDDNNQSGDNTPSTG